jgi:hypothetical protein
MYEHFRNFPWVLPNVSYRTTDDLLANFAERVIGPAERRLLAGKEAGNFSTDTKLDFIHHAA